VSRPRAPYRQSDLQRALKAARLAGVQVLRIEHRRDGFSIVAVDDSPAETEAERAERLQVEAFRR